MVNDIQTKQIVVRGVLVNYYSMLGVRQARKTLLFLHGWGADGKIWFPIMRELAHHDFLLVSIDFPGFGKSEMPPQGFSVDDYAGVVDDLIQKLGLQDVCLVAHSFGGRVAVKLAVSHPELVTKLVLVDSAGVRLVTKKLSLKQTIIRFFKPLLSLPVLRILRPYLYRLIASEDYLAYPHLRDTFIKVVNEDLTPLLPRVTQETLLVWGEKDTDTPLAAAEIMQKNIPHARLVVLKGAGHFSFLDDIKGFLSATSEFLGIQT